MTVYLRDDIKNKFPDSPSLFEQMMTLSGECFRRQPGRMTHRIKLGEKYFFIKQHTGVGWREIFKNLLQGRKPVLGANNELLAIELLRAQGINVPAIAGYGFAGRHPARARSFILLEEIAPVISLEDLVKQWQVTPPTFRFKRRLIHEVARIARIMHESGVNHRDFYICHFLLVQPEKGSIKIFLIDLHRAQVRKLVPERWLIKDLAGLYFSSLNIGLTQRDYYRFMQDYCGKNLREILPTESQRWENVKQRGEKLYHDHCHE